MENKNNQIFILYPHRNGESLASADHIWVSEFKKYLEAFYHQLVDSPIHITHKAIHPPKSTAVDLDAGNSTFICICSPEYLNENDYVQELEKLHQQQSGKNKSTLFHVIKFPLNEDQIPSWMQNQPQFTFYDKKPNTRKFIEVDFSREIVETHSIWHRFNDLVNDVSASINFYSGELQALEFSNNPVIFVAETTQDQEENRNKIIRELKQHGYQVLPGYRLPNRSKEIEPALNKMLDNSIMSIHMLGGLYGSYLKDSRYSITDFLNRSVRNYIKETDFTGRKFKRIIWIPPYLKISDQRQDLFLGRMKREENDQYTELIQSPLEELKTLIFNNINSLLDSSGNDPGKEFCLYVIHDPLHHSNLKNYILFLSNKGMRVLTLSFENEDSIIQQHINHLAFCHGVLIFDNGNTNWLEAKFRDLIKIKGYGRSVPFSFKAVLTNSDNGIEKLDEQITKDVVFLHNSMDLESVFEPLLIKMEEYNA